MTMPNKLILTQLVKIGEPDNGRIAIKVSEVDGSHTAPGPIVELYVTTYDPNTTNHSTTHQLGFLNMGYQDGFQYFIIDQDFADYASVNPTGVMNTLAELGGGPERTVAIELKIDGVTVDLLGDPLGTTDLIPGTGSLIRNKNFAAAEGVYDPTDWESSADPEWATYNAPFDPQVPTVAIALSDTSLAVGETATVTFTFSDAPIDFSDADVTAEGGVLSGLVATLDPKVYTATFTPTAEIEDGTNVITVGQGWTNASSMPPAADTTSANYVVDTKAPTVTITSDKTSLTIGETATIMLTFSEHPGWLQLQDIQAESGVVSNLSGLTQNQDGTFSATATYTPAANLQDPTVVISLASGSYTDDAGNSGDSGQTSLAVDTSPLPRPVTDYIYVTKGTLVTLPTALLLDNDVDPQDLPLSVTGVAGLNVSNLSLNSGTLEFSVNKSFAGGFTYDVVNSNSDRGTGTVLVSSVAATVGDDTISVSDVVPEDESGVMSFLDGAAGNDTLNGGSLTDYLIGSAGNDVLNGNDGADGLFGGDDNDRLMGGAGDDYLNGGSGDDRLDGGAGIDQMVGGVGDDIYTVNDIGDLVIEFTGEGLDTVRSSVTYDLTEQYIENLDLIGNNAINGSGNQFDNVITGNGAANLIDGRTGADTMSGGLGDDIYVVDSVGDVVTELDGEGTDTVRSSISYNLSGKFIENLELTGVNAINGVGNFMDNTITGNSANNVINGGLGADTMIGGFGDDTYTVDNVGDQVIELAGQGTDTVNSAVTYSLAGQFAENLTLTGTGSTNATGNGSDNVLIGNIGNNVLDGGIGADTLSGGLGDDTYVIDSVGDQVIELANQGTDTIQSSITYSLAGSQIENLTLTGILAIDGTGNDGANAIVGNSAANLLDGGLGADTMSGGLGDDIYVVDSADDVATELDGEGNDTVRSSISYDLTGKFIERLELTGVDAINGHGNAMANTIIGNSAANTIDGGAGADAMSGGLGDDIYVVDDLGDTVTELANQGTDTARASVTFSLMGSEVERLELTGSSDINATGNELGNTISGNSGANLIDGGLGADTMSGGLGNDIYVVDNVGDVVTELLDEGTDTVRSSISYNLSGKYVENLELTGTGAISGVGNFMANTIIGNTAANTINGGTGADVMIGGMGNDTYIVDNVGDQVVEWSNEGQDIVKASVSYGLAGTAVERLELTGSAAINGTGNELDNTLAGNSGKNTLDGGLGADTMSGGQGDDIYVVDNVGDQVVEQVNQGTDTIHSSVTYSLAGLQVERLELTGANAINATGNGYNNALVGNSAANVLDGGLGSDTMSGGLGDDTYFVDSLTDTVVELANEGTDTVSTAISYSLAGLQVENLVLTGNGAVNGTGNEFHNLMLGNDGANTLDGGAGYDLMVGGLGNDTYIVDDALDLASEAQNGGIDTVVSSVGFGLGAEIENLTLTGTDNIAGSGNSLVNILTGNAGNNLLDGSSGADTMIGGLGNDTYMVDDVNDQVVELVDGGTDTVISTVSADVSLQHIENVTLAGIGAINATGNALANTIIGNAAANTIDGGLGADTMSGGLGDDIYVVDNVGDVVTELAEEGNDTVRSSISYNLSGKFVERLELAGTDAISGVGNFMANTLVGNVAANTLNGGTGADTMIGSLGNDTYIVDNAGDQVVELANQGTDTVKSSISFSLAGIQVENLELTGTATINATGNEFANTLSGNAAANVLDGGLGADVMSGGLGDDVYLVDNAGDQVIESATGGNDTINASISFSLAGSYVEKLVLTGGDAINATGNSLANILIGNSAVNTLDGGTGADTMTGGLGDDTYVVDNVGDSVVETIGGGYDTVRSSVSISVSSQHIERVDLTGSSAINVIGNELDNTLNGNNGANTLDGGSGADVMTGKAGNDTYMVDNIGDQVIELASQGTDKVISTISFSLVGLEVEHLELAGSGATNGTGNGYANILTGNGGNNVLDGGSGADTINGGSGDDTLFGGAGTDQLTGGTGSDTFSFRSISESGAGNGRDVVSDFVSGTDKLDLSAIDATALSGDGDQAFVFVGSSAFSNIAGEARFDNGLLQADVNGDGIADFEVALTGVNTITLSDLVA